MVDLIDADMGNHHLCPVTWLTSPIFSHKRLKNCLSGPVCSLSMAYPNKKTS